MNTDSSDLENITIRRRPARCTSENDLTRLEIDTTLCSTTLFDHTIDSLPNLSTVEDLKFLELKQKNEELSMKLESAHTEIENLISENFQLKSEIRKCQLLINTLKQLNTTNGTELGSTNSTPRRKICTKSVKLKPLQDVLSPLLANIKQNSLIEQSTTNTRSSGVARSEKKEETITNNSTESNIINANEGIKYINSDIDKEITQNNSHDCRKRNNEGNSTTQSFMDSKKEKTSKRKKKIIIIGDQYGKNVGELLGNLLGPEYQVNSFLKPFADSKEVLDACKDEISNLNLSDCVVVLTGANDRNPFNFKCNVAGWVASCNNTNVIIPEVPRNDWLNLSKLNYELKFLCSNFTHAIYLDMDFSRFVPRKHHFALNLSRSLLQEILRIDYKQKYINYIKTVTKTQGCVRPSFKCDKASQTELLVPINCNVEIQTDFDNVNNTNSQEVESNDPDNLQSCFRDQPSVSFASEY